MSFRPSIYSLQWIKSGMQNDKLYAGKGEIKIIRRKAKKMCKLDFDNSRVIDKGSFCNRQTLEAWLTSATKHADNNSKLDSKPV